MKTYRKNLGRGWSAISLGVFIAMTASGGTLARKEHTFEVLQIGTRSYTNATVTRSSSHITVMHAGGMETLKVTNLPPEVKEQLGYELPKPKTNAVAGWTKAQMAKLNQQDVRKLSHELEAQIRPALLDPRSINPAILIGVPVVLLVVYLFFSYCGSLICQKTGNPPGALIWIPVLQLIPLIRAAGMAPIWFVAWLLPVVNIVAQVLWAFKISKARNKSAGVGLLLVFPLTSVFAFMYLAFSGGSGKPKDPKPKAPEIMTLEAA